MFGLCAFCCRGYCSPRLSAALARLGQAKGPFVRPLSLWLPLFCGLLFSLGSVRVVNALLGCSAARLCFACCAARLPLTVSRFVVVPLPPARIRMRYGRVSEEAEVRYGAVRVSLCYCYCVLCCALSLSAWRYAGQRLLCRINADPGPDSLYLLARLCSTCCLTYYYNYSFATLCHCAIHIVHIVLDCCVYLDLKQPYPKSDVSLSLFQFPIPAARDPFLILSLVSHFPFLDFDCSTSSGLIRR